jgi:hypothetical protein
MSKHHSGSDRAGHKAAERPTPRRRDEPEGGGKMNPEELADFEEGVVQGDTSAPPTPRPPVTPPD